MNADSAPVAEEVVAAARSLMADGQRRILGIAGPPASGKSSLAEYLAARLAPLAVSVPMDGFHLSQRELERLGRSDRKGAPDTFDVAGYRNLLRRIRGGYQNPGVVYAPDFDRTLEEAIAARIAIESTATLVVTEGNYLLLDANGWENVAPQLDEIWFIHVATDQREAWLAERHQQFGRSAAEAWAWIELTDRPNAALIEASAARAHRHLRWDGERLRLANTG